MSAAPGAPVHPRGSLATSHGRSLGAFAAEPRARTCGCSRLRCSVLAPPPPSPVCVSRSSEMGGSLLPPRAGAPSPAMRPAQLDTGALCLPSRSPSRALAGSLPVAVQPSPSSLCSAPPLAWRDISPQGPVASSGFVSTAVMAATHRVAHSSAQAPRAEARPPPVCHPTPRTSSGE